MEVGNDAVELCHNVCCGWSCFRVAAHAVMHNVGKAVGTKRVARGVVIPHLDWTRYPAAQARTGCYALQELVVALNHKHADRVLCCNTLAGAQHGHRAGPHPLRFFSFS